MPYTPPVLRSSPVSSPPPQLGYFATHHSISYGRPSHGLESPGPRPNHLPRSSSSSSMKSRKSADISPGEHTSANHETKGDDNDKEGLSINTNVRQSPPPVTNAVMPPGAIFSPPDSGDNSADETPPSRSSSDEKLEELHNAVRESLQLNRKGSPDPEAQDTQASSAIPNDSPVSVMDFGTLKAPSHLSHGARKISHSRSSTEPAVPATPTLDLPAISTSDGSEDEDSMGDKPLLIRKKSGELVKPAIRPRSRRKVSSMPGTPTYGKKGVHFNDDIAQVRTFLQVDRPMAVSAGGSPVENYEDDTEFPFGFGTKKSHSNLELRLGNFPRETHERQSMPVRVDKISLSTDQKSLVGAVVVANLSFHKTVAARFTFDNWRTTSEVVAEYNGDVRQKPLDQGYDLFNFSIRLTDHANLSHKTMLMCVRYKVNGQEFWDNNNHANFQVEFAHSQPPQSQQPAKSQVSSARPSLPRSRWSSHVSDGRPQTAPASSLDDDFAGVFDLADFRLKGQPQPRIQQPTPPRRHGGGSQQFGSRYDFGASLTTALKRAQDQMRGDQQHGTPRRDAYAGFPSEPPKPSSMGLARVAPEGVETPGSRPDSILAGQQGMDSRAYQEFVNKFCFFGSGKVTTPENQPSPSPNQPSQNWQTDGAQDMMPSSTEAKDAADLDLQQGPGPAESQSNEFFSGTPSLMSPAQYLNQHQSSRPSSTTATRDSYQYDGTESPAHPAFAYGLSNQNGFIYSRSTTPPAIQG